jgi:hypothetical protein
LHLRAHDALAKKLVIQPEPSTRKITNNHVPPNKFIARGAALRKENTDSQRRSRNRVHASCDKGNAAEKSYEVVEGCPHGSLDTVPSGCGPATTEPSLLPVRSFLENGIFGKSPCPPPG